MSVRAVSVGQFWLALTRKGHGRRWARLWVRHAAISTASVPAVIDGLWPDLAHIIMVCFGNRAIHPHYAVQDHQRHASGRSAITAFSPIRNAASKKVCHLTWSVWQMAY